MNHKDEGKELEELSVHKLKEQQHLQLHVDTAIHSLPLHTPAVAAAGAAAPAAAAAAVAAAGAEGMMTGRLRGPLGAPRSSTKQHRRPLEEQGVSVHLMEPLSHAFLFFCCCCSCCCSCA